MLAYTILSMPADHVMAKQEIMHQRIKCVSMVQGMGDVCISALFFFLLFFFSQKFILRRMSGNTD